MNWMTATRKSCPSARSTQPKPEVVFPFPFPVMTRKMPRRVSRPSVGSADPAVDPSVARISAIEPAYHSGVGVSIEAGRLAPRRWWGIWGLDSGILERNRNPAKEGLGWEDEETRRS